MPPKVVARSDRATGVLPVSGAARAASAKQNTSRLKLEIRRLPPSLTVQELEEVLGLEWRPGQGKVDWREYRQGKVRSPGKLPEQSRCYVHLVNEALVKEFEQRFLTVVFHDKAGTHKIQELKYLPPTLEYAPNQRVPLTTGKQRTDNRQGTIDQDPEFIAFLEAETRPITKAPAIDSLLLEREDAKQEIKSTPLIDDLREKKANKAKAAASKAEKKAHKHTDSVKDAAVSSKDAGKGKDKADTKQPESSAKESKGAKQLASKQIAKASSQQDTSTSRKKKERPQPSPKSAASHIPAIDATTPTSPAQQRAAPTQRARRDAEGIKKMLQKDLGIKPKDATIPAGSARSKSSQQSASTSQAPAQQPTGPKSASKSSMTTPETTTTTTSPKTSEVSTPTVFRAFLKHANPSQGMTETLISDALSVHGDVTAVSIDSRKGTAVAVFGSQDGLQKAIAAKKASVANGAVEILEFKDRSAGNASSRGTRGAPRSSRNKGNATTSAAPSTASASAATSSSATG